MTPVFENLYPNNNNKKKICDVWMYGQQRDVIL